LQAKTVTPRNELPIIENVVEFFNEAQLANEGIGAHEIIIDDSVVFPQCLTEV